MTTSKKKNKQQFNWIRLCERGKIPLGAKYTNPRVTFDGLNWWISIGIECQEEVEDPKGEGIGIDLGVSELAITSDGYRYKNINKSMKVRKLEKRMRLLQRKVSNKYQIGKDGEGRFTKTSNIIKLENTIKRLHQRLSNIRVNHLHQTSSQIIKRKPNFIVMEDLNVRGMMKNRHLSRAIASQGFYKFRRQVEYKAKWNGIDFILADRFYPSSKTCSSCKAYKKGLALSQRDYICEACGLTIDRDLNASLNLKGYGQTIVNH